MRVAFRISQDRSFAPGDEAVWLAAGSDSWVPPCPTQVTLALAMKGEMPLKRLSADERFSFSDSLSSRMVMNGHGWVDQMVIMRYR